MWIWTCWPPTSSRRWLPQDGGLTWVELAGLVGAALSRRDCLGWTLCSYDPDLDPDRTEARKIVDFVDDIAKFR